MKRVYFIDWLRILAILTVFLFHNSRFFDTLYWHVKNPEQSQYVLLFVGFIDVWIMPLFFLLSGSASVFSTGKSFRQYSWSKFLRLLLPFLMGIVLLIPPQKYLEALSHSHYEGSFFEFLGTYFSGGMFHYPMGITPSWIGVLGYHLWFLGHLFLISLVLFPIMRFLSDKGAAITRWIHHRISFSSGMLLLFIPVALVRILLKKSFPGYTDWADLAIYATYFLLGFILMKNEDFKKFLVRDSRIAWIPGVALFIIYLASYSMKGSFLFHMFQDSSRMGFYILGEAAKALMTWSWLVCILGLGVRFLDKEHSLRTPLNEAVLPFYILHQTVILVIGYFVVQWDWSNWSKFAVIMPCSFLVTVCLYYYLVRPFNVMRFLFGMTPLPSVKPKIS
jgi:glucans biosynthesis protein C